MFCLFSSRSSERSDANTESSSESPIFWLPREILSRIKWHLILVQILKAIFCPSSTQKPFFPNHLRMELNGKKFYCLRMRKTHWIEMLAHCHEVSLHFCKPTATRCCLLLSFVIVITCCDITMLCLAVRNLVAFSRPICLKILSPTLTRKDHWSWKKSQAHPTVSWVRQWLRWYNCWSPQLSSNTTKTIPECDQVRRCGNAALSSHNYPSEVEVNVLKFESKLFCSVSCV